MIRLLNILCFAGAILAMAPQATHAAVAVQLTGGDHQYCARTTAGTVYCWGRNNTGQLGNGLTSNSAVPVQVINLPQPVLQISGGPSHTCAVLADGQLRCWGLNANGQLGDGTLINRATPVVVTGLPSDDGVTAVAAGYKFSCALLASGRVKCWGSNVEGQLGNGNNVATTTPVDVLGISDARAIAAGSYHACAALQSGPVKCWGYGGYGQLGNGGTANNNLQTEVLNLSGVDALAAGIYHTCAKTIGGAVKCWGANNRGQLGSGNFNGATTPVDAVGLSAGVSQLAITSATNSSCAILAAGGAKCWGGNGAWQLGTGDNLDKNVPTTVVGLVSAPQFITIGWGDSCAGVSNGVQCRGTLNSFGEHGAGNSTTVTFPQSTVGMVGGGPAFAPQPLGPVNTKLPVYTWQAVPGASGYRLMVDGSSTIYSAASAGCAAGVGVCKITAAVAPESGVHSWQVQGVGNFGDGPWSDPVSFIQ